jgi:hypothetical protein
LDLLPTFSGFAAGAPAIASVANESPETSVGYASCVAEALDGLGAAQRCVSTHPAHAQ